MHGTWALEWTQPHFPYGLGVDVDVDVLAAPVS